MKNFVISILLVAAGAGAAVLGYRYLGPTTKTSPTTPAVSKTTSTTKPSTTVTATDKQTRTTATTPGTTTTPGTNATTQTNATTPETKNQETRKLVDAIFATNNNSVKVNYQSATLGDNNTLTMQGVQMRIKEVPNPVAIDNIVIKDYDRQNTPPHFYEMQIKGLRVDNKLIPDPRFVIALAPLGLNEIIVDMHVKSHFDKASKVQVATFELVLRQLGKLSIDMKFTDFDMATIAQVSKNPQPNPMLLINAFKVSKLKVSYQNLGLKEKLKDKLTPEMIMQAQQNIDKELSTARHPIQRMILSNVRKFLTTQNAFEISIEPVTPLNLMSFASIPEDKIVSQLNFRISAQ